MKAVEFWMEHKLPEQHAAYYRASETELREFGNLVAENPEKLKKFKLL